MASTVTQNLAILLSVFQAYYDSDVDVFTWGTPVTAIALFTFLLHLGIETKTWVRATGKVTLHKGPVLWVTSFPVGVLHI